MAENYYLPSIDMNIDRGVLNEQASRNGIDVNTLSERQQFELYALGKAYQNDGNNTSPMNVQTIGKFRDVTKQDLARDPNSQGWVADGFMESNFYQPGGVLSQQQTDYINSTGKSAVELGQPTYFQNSVPVWNGMGMDYVSQRVIDTSEDGKYNKAIDPQTGYATYYDNRAADAAAAAIQHGYGGNAPDAVWNHYLRSPGQQQTAVEKSQEYLREKAASKFKLGSFIAKSLVPSIVGAGFGTAIGGAAGLSNLSTQGLSGALSGGFSSGVQGEGLEGIALNALKGAGTSIAIGQAKDALGLNFNPFSGDGEGVSSDALLGAQETGSTALLNAPAGSPAGFSAAQMAPGSISAAQVAAVPTSEALLSAPSIASAAGFSASLAPSTGGSFLSTIGLDDMSPLTLLAGAGLLGGTIYSTNKQADAAEEAARIQAQSGQDAINSQERMLDKQIQAVQQAQAQADAKLQPYVDAGYSSLGNLQSLVTDPNAQMDYIQNNPFYQSLANDAQNRIFANAAASGKLGSGGTAEALQNSLVLLGQDLLNQNIQQNQNLASLGANAASGQATGIQNSANSIVNSTGNASNNIADLLTQIGNSQASGTVGAANATTSGFNNLVNTALAAYGLSNGMLY